MENYWLLSEKTPKYWIFIGYKSIAVPGELHGLWTAFKRHGSGRISWHDLILPTVNILNNGYPVSKLMEDSLKQINDQGYLTDKPTMK